VVTIIGIMSAMVLGALGAARESARESKTKATIAKLNQIIMEKYESYMTRRVPIDLSGLTPQQAAQTRLAALRDLMRMEMPERWNDVTDLPAALPNVSASTKLQQPALVISYGNRYNVAQTAYPSQVAAHSHAKCLYMIVAANPENLAQFSPSEVAIPDGDGLPVFVDGWGTPIYFLRWAPAFSPFSDIQSNSPTNSHDPFDTRGVDSEAFKLVPLIYSAGRNKLYGIEVGVSVHYYDRANAATDPKYALATYWQICSSSRPDYQANGGPKSDSGGAAVDEHFDNITNHHIEAR
jgi:hypothetical protein